MSRRPPSLRNAEYGLQQLARQSRSMIPGTAGGRLASASPVHGSVDVENLADSAAVGTPGEGSSAGIFDRFPASGTLSSSPSSLTLSAVPQAGTLHLYLNGLALDEGVDYTLTANVVALLTPAAVASGDVVVARYFYSDDVIDPSVWVPFSDTFTRANSTGLGTAETGQTWVAVTGTANVVSNKATFPTGSDGLTIANAGIADGTFSATVTTAATGRIDASLVFRSSSTGSDYLFAQLYNGASPGLRLAKTGGGPTGMVLDATFTPVSSTTYLIEVVISGSTVVVQVDGVTRISYTLTSGEATLFTGTYAGIRIAESDNQSTFDNIQATP